MKMKILIADILLAGQQNFDWKEGYELCYAFRNIGHECDVAGVNGKISELEIPNIAHNYDLIIITENYPIDSRWQWWDWKEIKTPKLFWAIDAHIIDFRYWFKNVNMDYIAFNNPEDIIDYNLPNSFWLPYAASKKHGLIEYTKEKKRDIVFIGGLMEERKRLCDKFNIECINAYGPDYMREMQASKICFNHSMSYNKKANINAKYFEILSSGSFMLTDYNENFHKYMDYNEDIAKMFYYSDDDLGEKIKYYLENEEEREAIAKRAFDYISQNHTWENRCELILSEVEKINNSKVIE
jgi:hypothetical protein